MKRAASRPLRKLSLPLTLLAAFLQPAVASDFEVHGYVEVIPADEAGNLLSASATRSQFTVSVRDDKWLLQSTTADGLCNLCGCDGANFYSLTTQTNIPGAATAEVASGKYPVGPNTIWVSLPWLTFASSHYLDSPNQRTMPAPWAFPRTDPAAFIYSAAGEEIRPPTETRRRDYVSCLRALTKAAPKNPLLETGSLNRQARDRNLAMLARVPTRLRRWALHSAGDHQLERHAPAF